jgi:hypothetical protein
MRNILALCLLLLGGAAFAAEESSLIITYQMAPGDRPAFRQQMVDSGLPRFQEWKEKGILKAYRVLAARYADAGNWDFMAILSFAKPADLERWKEVEQGNPAGLTSAMLDVTTSIASAPADLIRQEGADAKAGVFLVIPYEYLVPAAEYVTYLDGYTLPQFKGWISEKVLAGYGVYLSRYPAGRPWNAMLLLQYQSEAALAERDRVVQLVRARLKDNPEWKAWADNKKAIRDERQAVVADELLLGNRK